MKMKNNSFIAICIKICEQHLYQKIMVSLILGLVYKSLAKNHSDDTILLSMLCHWQVHANSMNIMFAQRITFRIDTHLYIYCSLAHTPTTADCNVMYAYIRSFCYLFIFMPVFFFLFVCHCPKGKQRTNLAEWMFVLNNGHIFITTVSFRHSS